MSLESLVIFLATWIVSVTKQLTQRLRHEFHEQLQTLRLSQKVLPVKPLVAPTLMSIKGNCAALTWLGEDIGKNHQCELLVEDNFTARVVAIGKVFEGVILHNVSLPLMW